MPRTVVRLCSLFGQDPHLKRLCAGWVELELLMHDEGFGICSISFAVNVQHAKQALLTCLSTAADQRNMEAYCLPVLLD